MVNNDQTKINNISVTKTEYNKKLAEQGLLGVSCATLKILDIKTALVFARLNAEFNYAFKNNYLYVDCFFATDKKNIANVLRITVDDVKTSIDKLKRLGFISTTEINSYCWIHIYCKDICNKINELKCSNWDFGLNDIQRNAILDLESSLDNATFIKEFNRQQRATDENGNPLLF